jgi:L-asparaginase
MTVPDRQGPHVVVLATGGTISSRVQAADGATVPADSGEQVLGSLRVPSPYPVRVVDVFRKGSYLLTLDDMTAICAKISETLTDPMVVGVVVMHGTDTMEETAYLADLIIDDPRSVVFTGAQNSADSPEPDGPDNLAEAIAVASSPEAAGRGVLVCFAGEIFPARGVRKTHTLDLHAFTNPDIGSAGSVTAESKVLMEEAMPRPDHLLLTSSAKETTPRVDLVAAYPGADSVLFQASRDAGAAGVVLEATGSGNANLMLCEAIANATAAGVVVVTSTRVHSGPVIPVYGTGGGIDLLAAGAIPSGLLRPSQSLVLLSLLLRLGTGREEIARTFARHGALP